MSQAANLFNQLVPKGHNSECQNLHFLYKLNQQKWFKTSWRIFIFCILGLNGLIELLARAVNYCIQPRH